MVESKNVFVDVDDTLARSFGSKVIPNTSVIEKVKALHSSGYAIWVWSTAGAEYSKSMCEKIGIEKIVKGYFTKPDYIIDDQPVDKWINTKYVHPLQVNSISIKN